MAKGSLPSFEEALKAGQSYVRASVRARDAQYRFLALTYLAHLEGQKRPRIFKQLVEARLGRSPTKPEEKRPFLSTLHSLVGSDDNNALPQLSKLTTALEEIDKAFHCIKPVPKVDDLIDFIKDAGGVAGLFELSKVGTSGGADSSQSGAPNVVDLKPNEIHIPLLGARITKVGRGYRLRLTEWHPGEYQVRLRVGRGGFVEAIVDESADSEDVA
jgi:hypothetical protein